MTGMPATDSAVFWAVAFSRLALPLFIPKFPLPAILACFAVDAVDQSVFEAFTGFDLAGYQGYDKALDVFYLSVAMLATYRNWASRTAVQIARVLFYLRLAGVLVFELSHWRPVLLLLPNAFEYFFIFYEVARGGWSPTRMKTRQFVAAAAVIWVAVKIPQEYWIHIARLDLTDVIKGKVFGAAAGVGWGGAIAARPAMLAVLVAAVVALVVAGRALVVRFAGPPAHAFGLAAAPLPVHIDEARERDRHIARRWRLFDRHLLEKIVLVAFVTIIFAEILPGVDADPLQIGWGVVAIVTINTLLRLRAARAERSRESAAMSFALLAVINIGIVVMAERLLRRSDGGLPVSATLFFLLLLTLIVTLYDHWRPVFDARSRNDAPDGGFKVGVDA